MTLIIRKKFYTKNLKKKCIWLNHNLLQLFCLIPQGMIVDYSFTIEPLMFIRRFGHRPSSMITQLILCPLHVDVVVVVVNEWIHSSSTSTCSGHNIKRFNSQGSP